MSLVVGFVLLDYWIGHETMAVERQPSEVWGRYRIQSVEGGAAYQEKPPLVPGAIVYFDYRGEAGVRTREMLRLGQYHVDPGAKRIEVTLYNADATYLHELDRTFGEASKWVFVPENVVLHLQGSYRFGPSRDLVIEASDPAGVVVRLVRDELNWPDKHRYLRLAWAPDRPGRGTGGPVTSPSGRCRTARGGAGADSPRSSPRGFRAQVS
jgi:hypothetical protein